MEAHDTSAGLSSGAIPWRRVTFQRLIIVGCCGALALGLLGLAGQLFDRPLFAGLLPNAAPMTPTAAVLIILLAGLLLARGVRPPFRAAVVSLAALVTFFGLVESACHLPYANWCPNNFMFARLLPTFLAPFGNIAPLATVLASLVGGSILILISVGARPRPSRRRLGLAGCLGLLSAMTGGIFLLGYLYGTPLVYGHPTVPLTFPSSLAFILLGCAVVVAAGPDAIPLRWFAGGSTRARLLRVFLPFVVVAVLATDLVHLTIHHLYGLNSALISFSSVVITVFVSAALITLAARRLGHAIDDAHRERLNAEQALAEEKELLLVTLRSIGDAVIATDRKGRVVLLNAVAEAMTGWTMDEARGRPVTEVFHIVHEYTRAPVDDPTARVLREGVVVGLANHTALIARDGREYSIADSGAPIRNAAGEIIGVVLVFRDVTEEREAEEALLRSEERFRTLFDTMTDGVVILDAEWKITLANPAAEHILGVTAEEMYGCSALDPRWKAIHDDLTDFPNMAHPAMVALAAGQSVRDGLMGIYCPQENAHRWISISATPLTHPGETRPAKVYTVFRDVTEHKRAQEALEESERRYRELFESNPHPMWVYDREHLTFLTVNDAAVEHYGYTREEFLAMTILDLHPAEDHAVLCDVARMTPSAPCKETWRHLTKAGDLIDVKITTHDLHYSGRAGRLVHAIDVTERSRAEQALAGEREKLKSILDSMADGVYIVDADHVILYANPALERDFGAVDGRACYEYFHGLAAPCPFCRRAEVFAGQTVNWEWYYDRVEKYYDLFATPLRNPDGSIVKLEIMHDITARKRAEAALRESESRYRALFDGAMDGIVVLRDGRFVDCNPRAVALFGGTRAQLLGEAPHTLIPARQADGQDSRARAQALLRQALDGDTPSFEWCFRRFDGTTFFADVSLNRVYLDGALLVQGILRDITERKRAEEQLRHTAKMESIGQLAGGIAHDFNNILTGIIGLTQIIQAHEGESSPIAGDLDEMLSLAHRAANLTRQLLAFSRRQPIEPQLINPNLLIDNLLKLLKRLIGEDIALHFLPAADIGTLYADPGQMEQLLLNLAVNARDAMPAGGTLTIETANVELDAAYAETHPGVKAGSYVRVTVSDSGFGMDEGTRAHIFEPFFTTKGIGQGTGLGLATVYGIVKQHGGNIWVYSEPGQGSVFKVYLPRHEVEGIEEPPRAVARQRDFPRGRETILLVEDEPAVREVAERILEDHGYTVLAAASPSEAEALHASHQGDIALLLSDVVMPECNGMELHQALRVCHPALRALFMSGYSDATLPRMMTRQPGMALLQKPFTPEELLHRVRQVLDAPVLREET